MTCVRSYAQWLLLEPRFVWLCLVSLGAAVLVPVWFCFSEPSIRISGLVLQLGGIVSVVWGVLSTREFFGLPPIRNNLILWWGRAPFRPQNVVAGVGGSQLTIFGEGQGYTSMPVDHSAPVDERIKVLERNVTMIHERIGAVHSDFRRKHDDLKSTVSEHGARLEQVQTKLSAELRNFGTSGLHISAIGAAWLFLGSIMGSASQEIAKWLQ